MNVTFRPLGVWTEPETTPRKSSGRFRASWPDTLDLLNRELEHLDARNVVVQVDCDESQLRRDGMPKANARVGHPGVRLSFESRLGPLTYATDAYEAQWSGDMPGWQANLRAIALSLEALRAVDRYGVTRRGEQYRGWNALPPGQSADESMTLEQAARLLIETAGLDRPSTPDDVDAVLRSPLLRSGLFRQAAAKTHPDRGGDPEAFRRLVEARTLIDQHGGPR